MERSAAARDDDERPRSRWELVRAGFGEPGGLSGRSLSRWRGLAAQARTVWKGWARRTSGSPGPAPNRGAEAAVVSGATGGIAHSHFSSGGVIGRRPSRPRRGDRALLGSG